MPNDNRSHQVPNVVHDGQGLGNHSSDVVSWTQQEIDELHRTFREISGYLGSLPPLRHPVLTTFYEFHLEHHGRRSPHLSAEHPTLRTHEEIVMGFRKIAYGNPRTPYTGAIPPGAMEDIFVAEFWRAFSEHHTRIAAAFEALPAPHHTHQNNNNAIAPQNSDDAVANQQQQKVLQGGSPKDNHNHQVPDGQSLGGKKRKIITAGLAVTGLAAVGYCYKEGCFEGDSDGNQKDLNDSSEQSLSQSFLAKSEPNVLSPKSTASPKVSPKINLGTARPQIGAQRKQPEEDKKEDKKNDVKEPAANDKNATTYSDSFNNLSKIIVEKHFKKQENQGKNLVFSPFVAGVNLLSLELGASEKLKKQFNNLFGRTPHYNNAGQLTELQTFSGELSKKFDFSGNTFVADKTKPMEFGSGIGGDLTLKEQFQTDLGRDFFNSKAFGTLSELNKFVRPLMGGPDLKAKPNTSYLVTAATFNAKWKYPFEKKKNKPENFTKTDKNSVSVTMMHRKITGAVCDSDSDTPEDGDGDTEALSANGVYVYKGEAANDVNVVVLPYIEVGLRAVFIQPTQNDGTISSPAFCKKYLTAKLSGESFGDRKLHKLKGADSLELALPKLEKLTNDLEFTNIIEEQIPLAFQAGNLDNLSYQSHLSQVSHNASLTVDELGTSGGATQISEIVVKSGGGEHFNIVLNSPFLMLVKKDDVTLFAAFVQDPSSSK